MLNLVCQYNDVPVSQESVVSDATKCVSILIFVGSYVDWLKLQVDMHKHFVFNRIGRKKEKG